MPEAHRLELQMLRILKNLSGLEAKPGFVFPSQLRINKSPPHSPHVVMTPHHILLYTLIEHKKECSQVEIHRREEKARGAA